MKHLIQLVCTAALVGLILPMSATDALAKKPKKKGAKTEVSAPKTKPETEYDKLFKDKKCETVRGMMTLHDVEGKLYVELPLALLGRDMLIGSTVS